MFLAVVRIVLGLVLNRNQFSAMLDTVRIDQLVWFVLTFVEETEAFVLKVGIPVLVRPSFVLSGAAMRVASDHTELKNFLALAEGVAADKPIVVTKFILGAYSWETDSQKLQNTIWLVTASLILWGF